MSKSENMRSVVLYYMDEPSMQLSESRITYIIDDLYINHVLYAKILCLIPP